MFGFGGNSKKPEPAGQPENAGTLTNNSGAAASAGAAAGAAAGNNGYSFDPTGLERAAKAARDLDASRHAKEAFQLAKETEKTKQYEHTAKAKENEVLYKQYEIQRVQIEAEAKRKNYMAETEEHKKRAQYQDQLKRKQYADQLAAQKYMKEQELKKQEEMIAREEAMKRKTLEYEAELRQKTEMAKVSAEVEGRIKQERLNHDLHLEQSRVEAKEYRETVMEGISLATKTIGNGVMTFVEDKEKLTATVVSLTALAVGVYSAKVSTGVAGRYIEARLGKPSLVRETSRQTVSQMVSHPVATMRRLFGTKPTDALEGVVLEPGLDTRLRSVATSTWHTKRNKAPFRHLLLHGAPGTGKTLFAKSLAKHSGLEYAILTGGDVAPLGREGVTEIHKLFDWASHSRKGLLLFVDEADAFLQKRSNTVMSEDLRNALNAFLYRTGEATDKFMIVFATNQPEQFDWAINDRIDEMVEFVLPGREERVRMLELYISKYLRDVDGSKKKRIVIAEELLDGEGNLDRTLLESIADRIDGFSGREISKLAIAWQAAAYGNMDAVVNKKLFIEVLDHHLTAHRQKEEWKKHMGPVSKDAINNLLQ